MHARTGPPTRWSAARKSAEFRVYRSLPSRHQEYREIIARSEIVKPGDVETSNNAKEPVIDEATLHTDDDDRNDPAKGDPAQCKDAIITKSESISVQEKFTPRVETNERTNPKRGGEGRSCNKQEEEVASLDAVKTKRNERSLLANGNKTKIEEQEQEVGGSQEQCTPRISLIKPPRILSKFISPEIKSGTIKHGERKSNIPIFKRSCKEFEDIRSPQESPKRSLIPQR